MRDYGWSADGDDDTRDLVLIPQNAASLHNALSLTESDLRHQLINYNENPVDRWCFGNAGLQTDKYGKSLCIKQQPKGKIDGTVTLIILQEMYRRNRTEFAQMVKMQKG